MMTFTLALLLLASEPPPARNVAELAVDQLAAPKTVDVHVDDLGAPDGRAAISVSQLPGDLEADPAAVESEPALASTDKRDLTAEVARAWELIRQRGQQPTPELIAREIGPDTLTAFLNQNPGGIDIFTRDTAPPDPQHLDGKDIPRGIGVVVLPPGGGQ